LRGVGLIHGNVVRPPCFDVGEQRKQRHMFESWCRLKEFGYGDLSFGGRTVGGALLSLGLLVLLIVKYAGASHTRLALGL
jgi:hypothetical protein